MNVKRYLKECAEKDRREILESEKSQSILRGLIEKEQDRSTQTSREQKSEQKAAQSITCPDCGNALLFNPTFGRFMHENCEKLNCWYAANELGKCVDNNEMRAARISKFSGLKF